jgi:uncharacterized protein
MQMSSDNSHRLKSQVFTTSVLSIFLVFLCFTTFGAILQFLNSGPGICASSLLVFALFPALLFSLVPLQVRPFTGLSSRSPSGLAFGTAFGLVNFFAWVAPLMFLAQLVFPARMLEAFNMAQLFSDKSPLELTFLTMGICLFAPACEEFFFRGLLQNGLAQHMTPSSAIVVTALIFSAFHLDPVGFIPRFELGVVFGLLAFQTKSLWTSIGAHFANNSFSMMLYFFSDDEPQQMLPWMIPLAFFVFGNVGLWLLVQHVYPRVKVERPFSLLVGKAQSLVQVSTTFILATLAAFALVWFFDSRGALLNTRELLASPLVTCKMPANLKSLRKHAQRGEVTLDEYFLMRNQWLSDQKEGAPNRLEK